MDIDTQKSHHPKALPFLFLTEMWERFGFYVVQGLLVLYLTQFYGYSDQLSYTISGVFTGLVYIAPFIGGFLADKLIGYKTAILWGGCFLIAGYFMLALFRIAFLFELGLATIVIGNGLLKPNISSLLGTQYANNDPARDSGFTLFYIGINIGAFLSGFSGYIREAFGWPVAFAVAGCGMIIGILTYLYGLKYLKPAQNLKPVNAQLKWQLLFYCLLAIIAVSFLLHMDTLAMWILPGAGVVLFVFLIVLTLQQPPEFRARMIVLDILILSSIIFWMLFLQIFNSGNLYVERLVDKNIFGLHLTTTFFYASEAIYIILLGPIFAWSWHTLGRNQRNPSPIIKFVAGIFMAGVCFLILAASTLFPNANGLINPLWIFLAYLVLTIGELMLSPIGLSAVTMLAPPQLIGMMMGIWFVATGFGGLFAGWLATLSSMPEKAMTTTEKLMVYQTAFLDYAYLALFVAIVLLFVNLAMGKMKRG